MKTEFFLIIHLFNQEMQKSLNFGIESISALYIACCKILTFFRQALNSQSLIPLETISNSLHPLHNHTGKRNFTIVLNIPKFNQV